MSDYVIGSTRDEAIHTIGEIDREVKKELAKEMKTIRDESIDLQNLVHYYSFYMDKKEEFLLEPTHKNLTGLKIILESIVKLLKKISDKPERIQHLFRITMRQMAAEATFIEKVSKHQAKTTAASSK